MKATDVVKSWESLSDFIFARVSGVDKSPLSEEFYNTLNTEGVKVLEGAGLEALLAKAKNIMEFNILDKDVDFKFFEKIPNLWSAYYKGAMASV